MIESRLYRAIGVPVVMNAADGCLEEMRDLWRAELRRSEEVLDARLNHIEDKLGIGQACVWRQECPTVSKTGRAMPGWQAAPPAPPISGLVKM